MNVESIKELREKTGLGVMDCKKALEAAGGNLEKAIEILKLQGLKLVDKKAGRETKEGLIGSYVHTNGKIGVLVEVNCESDFVAKTDEFKALVKDLTLQIAAANPAWLERELVPEDVLAEQRRLVEEQYRGKPAQVMERILEGKRNEFFRTNVLLEQPFIKDEELTIKDYIAGKIAKLGENIKVRRFVRLELNG